MVKAVRVHRPGGPEVLRLEDIELPPPGPGEVQLRHHAIGVNYIDIYRRSGAYPAELPFVPLRREGGRGYRGRRGVKTFEPGDRVAYVGALGGYSEARNIAAASLAHLPKSFSYAMVPCHQC